MSAAATRLLRSVGGAIIVLALGVFLNRAFDLQVHVLFPGSLLVNRLVPFSAYPTSLKLVMVLLNLLIWVAVLFFLGVWVTRWRAQRQPPAM